MPTTPAPTTAIWRPPMPDPGLVFRFELHGDAVHAIALARGVWAVVENVTQMTAAAMAMHLGARQEQLEIARCLDRTLDGREEARPTRAAIELGVRSKELERAGRADEHPAAVLVVEWAREGPLRAVLPEHPELLGRQLLAP